MKIISTGSTLCIYPDDLKTYDSLPLGTYRVGFSEMSGFFLTKIENLRVNEPKLYGNHEDKMDKVVRAYKAMTRSLGIILSGYKGMGKSLAIRLLCEKAELPVIIVDRGYPGIVNFIDSIEQEVLVVLDEFEKHFPKESENMVSQEDWLGLFDGTSNQKRIYAVSANEVSNLSPYLLNRPGRFHYHLKFDFLGEKEVREYIADSVPGVTEETLGLVAKASGYTKMNFDILRAIAFELNLGSTLEDALGDLNIEVEQYSRYRIVIATKDYGTFKTSTFSGKLFSGTVNIDYAESDKHYTNSGKLRFDPSNVIVMKGALSLTKFQLTMSIDVNCDSDNSVEFNEDQVVSISIIQDANGDVINIAQIF